MDRSLINRFLIFCACLAAGILGHGAASAASPLYENNGPIVSPPSVAPQIDAFSWVNRSQFSVSTILGLPYESQNTSFFTNTASGRIFMDPGIRFFRNTNGLHLSMDTWVNEGTINTDHGSLFAGTIFVDSQASILQVQATNIISKGPLTSGAHGLVHLEGKRISVPRIGIRTGEPDVFIGSVGGFIGLSNYVNDVGVTDLYWGAGTNNSVRAGGGAMPLNSFFGRPDFSLPFPSSPIHEIISRAFGFLFTNTTVVPGTAFVGTNIVGSSFLTNGFAAAVFTNQLSLTSSVVQVVFYPTNTDPSSSVDVRFAPFGFGAAEVYVAFHAADFDIATQNFVTNSVYLTDALGTTTNVFLARNLRAATRRPSTYEITRSEPFGFFFGSPSNATFTTDLLAGPQFLRNAVTNLYAAYGARIENLGFSPSGSIPYNVTNVPGRVTIIGDEVNLDQTRIRSESAVVIKANNLISNHLASVDTPLLNFDVGSTQPTLVISNLAPQTVKRFNGSLQAWSGRWQNDQVVSLPSGVVVTNNVLFHVLIVDSQLQAQIPVSVNEFSVRGNNHVISDMLTIGKSVRFEGDSVTIDGGLVTPFGYGLGASNLVGLLHFTNNGIILAGGLQNFGTDRPTPYVDFVNRGTNSGYSIFIRSDNVENSGWLQAAGGPLNIDALNLTLAGVPYLATTNVFTNVFFDIFSGLLITNVFTNTVALSSPARLDSISDVRLNVDNMVSSNGWITAGTLVLNVTDNISDAGTSDISFWSVTNGFQSFVLPTTSSLLGTYLRSEVPRLAQSDHIWAAADLGASPAGYVNNLALGKLTFDGADRTLFTFSPANGVNAIYADYLELLNTATNYNTAFAIDPNFTIYFANANVSVEKLNGALGGRFRWVSDFAGPLSSTNIFYPSTGETYTFNSALVRSKDLDSDGDGIANANDPEPIYVPANAFLTVELAHVPQRHAVLRWSALAYSTNAVEYKNSGSGAWMQLTNFVHGGFTSPVSITDPVPTAGGSRLYRLKVNPLQP